LDLPPRRAEAIAAPAATAYRSGMTRPDTTLTDLFLAVLCFGFAGALMLGGGLHGLYALLFAALGLASLFGAIWHGWFPGALQGTGKLLWLLTLIAIGGANCALWQIAGNLMGSAVLGWIAIAQLVVYLGLVFFWTQDFRLASAFSLPPTLVLLAVFALRFAATGSNGFLLGLAALVVALAGAGLQAARIGLPALGLGYNGLYHVVQAVAFTLLFIGRPGA
jgi:hypothetical protein